MLVSISTSITWRQVRLQYPGLRMAPHESGNVVTAYSNIVTMFPVHENIFHAPIITFSESACKYAFRISDSTLHPAWRNAANSHDHQLPPRWSCVRVINRRKSNTSTLTNFVEKLWKDFIQWLFTLATDMNDENFSITFFFSMTKD